MLVIAMNLIFAACVLYTVGVWGEKISKKLRWRHVALFWTGFVCDTIGTGAMGAMVGSIIQINFHGLTGLAAVALMLFHAIWATIVMIRNDERMKLNFHKFSIAVWVIWLIPMVSGIVFGATV